MAYVLIRPMTAETVEAVAELERQCFSRPWSPESLQAELENPVAVVYTAHIDDQLAGYAGMHHIFDEGCINNIAVSPAFRRRGVGSALLQGLLAYAADNALALLTLEVRESNKAAIALYQGFGFQERGRRRGYYQSPKEDALLLTRFF